MQADQRITESRIICEERSRPRSSVQLRRHRPSARCRWVKSTSAHWRATLLPVRAHSRPPVPGLLVYARRSSSLHHDMGVVVARGKHASVNGYGLPSPPTA
jgi:hypothetical protein